MKLHEKTIRALLAAFFFLFPFPIAASPVEFPASAFCPADALAIRNDSPAFPDGGETPSMRRYLDFYGLDFPMAEHRWGFIDSRAGRIFVQGFEPADGIGTLLFIHGYMSHSGCQAPLIADALSRGWAVYLMDLPGHGLSDGASCDIDDFDEYGEAASAFADAVAGAARKTDRLVAAGHSTGCSAWLISMQKRGAPFESVLFGAPLVRSASWTWSKIGLFLGGAFIRDLPRGKYKGPGIQPYPFDVDPLAPARFPIHWVGSLFAWNQRNASYPKISARLIVVQGEADTAVDWRYNLPFLRDRFSDYAAVYVKGGSHELFRYSGEEEKAFESVLDECLGKAAQDEGIPLP
jgi:alpha-beta hydrolase superfamily lysophospholipase